MKHVVLAPKGETYLTVYQDKELLKMVLPKYPGYSLNLDAKAIPQLINILKDIQRETRRH